METRSSLIAIFGGGGGGGWYAMNIKCDMWIELPHNDKLDALCVRTEIVHRFPLILRTERFLFNIINLLIQIAVVFEIFS